MVSKQVFPIFQSYLSLPLYEISLVIINVLNIAPLYTTSINYWKYKGNLNTNLILKTLPLLYYKGDLNTGKKISMVGISYAWNLTQLQTFRIQIQGDHPGQNWTRFMARIWEGIRKPNNLGDALFLWIEQEAKQCETIMTSVCLILVEVRSIQLPLQISLYVQ